MATLRKVIKTKNGKPVTNKNGEILIYLRYGHLRKRVMFSTGVKIPVEFWQDDQTHCIKRQYKGCKNLLNDIESIVDRVRESINYVRSQKKEPTTELVKHAYNELRKKSISNSSFKKNDVLQLFQNFIDENAHIKRRRTIAQYKVAKNHLKAYIEKFNFNPTLDIYNGDFQSKFLKYFYDLGRENVTASTHLKVQKTFLNWLLKKGYKLKIHPSELKRMRPKPINVYLTTEELKKIESVELTGSNDEIRDLFLFQCETGVRIGDLVRITKDNLIDGKLVVEHQEKTGKRLSWPLSSRAERILKKYDYSLPKKVLQYYNREIKHICKKAGINLNIEKQSMKGPHTIYTKTPKWKLVTSHTAIKSLITNCLDAGIPIKVLAERLGKSEQVIYKHYEGSRSEEKTDALIRSLLGNRQTS